MSRRKYPELPPVDLSKAEPAAFARIDWQCKRCGSVITREANAEGWLADIAHDCPGGGWEIVP